MGIVGLGHGGHTAPSMQQPRAEIGEKDTLTDAIAKVEAAYEPLGATLLGFENLNSFLPVSTYCNFFQTCVDGRERILVVMVGEWDEKAILTVLNVLLELRMDPDPPGSVPLFRFYGAGEVPAVLRTLFGDSKLCDFECRAVLLAHFGKELRPDQALQFAAVAQNLLRECVGVETGFFDPVGIETLNRAVVGRFVAERLGDDAAPLNALICIGFLYGEMLRVRYAYPCRWVALQAQGPWPLLAFSAPAQVTPSPVEGPAKQPSVVFNPIGTLISLYKGGKDGLLEEAAAELAMRLKAELEAPSKNA